MSQAAHAATGIDGLEIHGSMEPGYDKILTTEALAFVAELQRMFSPERDKLLAARGERQKKFDAGELPNFLEETKAIRDGDWKVAPIPEDLLDRRTEITGPVDRKMIINALNSGAKMFMADFEDATSPTWTNLIDGQVNLNDWANGTLEHKDPKSGKEYKLNDTVATLIVRPRGWHLPEQHMTVDGKPMIGGLMDFGLYCFHNAKKLVETGRTPSFYLPKLESHKESALWDKVFTHAEKTLGLDHGTLKATILIETLPAAFEMDEILHSMKDHIVGLNCGRWDYIFSYIKTLRNQPAYLLPDRSQVVMGSAFLNAYSLLLIKTTHRRGAFAMGGMAAQIPVKNNPEANKAAFAKVTADKEREAKNGHDGTWVAHPDLVPVAMAVFDRVMPQSNQLDVKRDDVSITQAMMLEVHEGERTEGGMREAIRVGTQYIEAWLRGRGAVPLYNLMEDAATAEICRSQIWQWIKFGADLSDGTKVTKAYFEKLLTEEMAKLRDALGADVFDGGRFDEAVAIFREMSTTEEFVDFLTLPAYRQLVTYDS